MRPIRVLIAEDDARIAEIQRRFLARIEGVELCGIAHSLADARDQLDMLQPDLVLLDVYFPDGNGLDLLKELRAGDSPCDVILITAAREVEALRSALRGGVFDYILKPLVFDRLDAALERYRIHREKLDNLDDVAQAEVDTLLPRNHPEPARTTSCRLPKGIDGITLGRVRDVVRANGGWSAEEVGAQLGASRTTTRRYLEYLVTAEELTAEVSYGTVGRPERRYRFIQQE
ncbi:response regulator [Salinisphaera sp. USBA-960]|uniref:response regulator n=1 Tax=Salinisphaera orenii TaxID=856731 RepID=UPI000DBE83A8|nr:response regulator [Salifodinibacter halophilus]NNC26598.1 response regulator [Salifodinibacter halophilus]